MRNHAVQECHIPPYVETPVLLLELADAALAALARPAPSFRWSTAAAAASGGAAGAGAGNSSSSSSRSSNSSSSSDGGGGSSSSSASRTTPSTSPPRAVPYPPASDAHPLLLPLRQAVALATSRHLDNVWAWVELQPPPPPQPAAAPSSSGSSNNASNNGSSTVDGSSNGSSSGSSNGSSIQADEELVYVARRWPAARSPCDVENRLGCGGSDTYSYRQRRPPAGAAAAALAGRGAVVSLRVEGEWQRRRVYFVCSVWLVRLCACPRSFEWG